LRGYRPDLGDNRKSGFSRHRKFALTRNIAGNFERKYNMFEALKGKKTYLVAVIAAALAGAESLGYVIPVWVWPVLGSLGLGTLRHAVTSA
jgi:hypothetical protein